MKAMALVLSLATLPVFAASVKVTSFNWIRSGEPHAELCGLVEGATQAPSFIRVVVDHRSARPAVYNTLAGSDGKFCLAVITYRGTAETSLFGGQTKLTATID